MEITRRKFVALSLTALAFNPVATQADAEERLEPQAASVILPPIEKDGDPVSYSFEDLIDKDGNVLTAQDTEGKYILVYGGYLECTGVCPGAANALVGAMKELKENDPQRAALIMPVVVMIKNNNGDQGEDVKRRAGTWQNGGLENEATGIRVFASPDQDVLDEFMQVFGNSIEPQEEGTLVHSPWAYLFDAEKHRFLGLVQTQQGQAAVLRTLQQKVELAAPQPALAQPEPSGQ